MGEGFLTEEEDNYQKVPAFAGMTNLCGIADRIKYQNG